MQQTLDSDHLTQLHTLTHISQQFSPLLVQVTEGSRIIVPGTSASTDVNELYQYWKANYPEAGPIYWFTRTWTMLIWQPVTIALVTTYYTQAVPPISTMVQGFNRQNGVVGQFDFSCHEWQLGDQHQRREHAAKQLTLLLTHLLSNSIMFVASALRLEKSFSPIPLWKCCYAV